MKSFFITGTDTDCGKTYVVCALLSYYAQQHKKVMGLKPVASGCFLKEGELVNDDALRIQALNPVIAPVSCRNFEPPVAPHLAALQTNQPITLKELIDFCDKPKQYRIKPSLPQPLSGAEEGQIAEATLDYLLIEGAGGLMVPLNDHATWVDFLQLTSIPVIIVVGMQLGCINHALLTASALAHQHIACAGWIANCLDPDMLMLEDNIQTLKNKMGVSFLGRVAFNGVFMPADELN